VRNKTLPKAGNEPVPAASGHVAAAGDGAAGSGDEGVLMNNTLPSIVQLDVSGKEPMYV